MAETLRFHLWKTSASQPYHWTLNAIQNGQVICTSENYLRKADAKRSMDLVYVHASDATFDDHTGEA
ncbi:YegP family protein (plasmid) [Clavibacter michiganensis]|uniref:YegP family protein n=1 Tax=Clavibacter michiganensis TaxID=28447 RepID=UPI002931396C|nr:YegP family protein [Clavibacter michiganensis]